MIIDGIIRYNFTPTVYVCNIEWASIIWFSLHWKTFSLNILKESLCYKTQYWYIVHCTLLQDVGSLDPPNTYMEDIDVEACDDDSDAGSPPSSLLTQLEPVSHVAGGLYWHSRKKLPIKLDIHDYMAHGLENIISYICLQFTSWLFLLQLLNVHECIWICMNWRFWYNCIVRSHSRIIKL